MHMRARVRILAVALVPCALAVTGMTAGPAIASPSSGTIVFSGAPGTSAPPLTLGPYLMTPFPADAQPEEAVTSVAGPTGALGLSPALEHCPDRGCWATWSNGYNGDVYVAGPQTITLTLPAGTKAFYFYAEPDEFETFSFTATSSNGTTSGAVPVNGNAGARYFGFYGTGSSTISSITVSGADPDGFAVGEFGISDGTAHYVVNAEAWIPFAQVVDPLFAFPLPYIATIDPVDEALDPNCFTPPVAKRLTTIVSSTYGGDNHVPFGTGTYRLRTEVSFDLNQLTGQLSNLVKDPVVPAGTSSRTKIYTSRGVVLDTCTQTATAVNTQVAQATSGTTFTLGYRGKNPLSQPADLTPPAHALIRGTVAADGTLTLAYTTTDFPSQGIQVSINGTPVSTDTENDVSCLGQAGVLGVFGVVRLATGLVATESGAETVDPTTPSTTATPSPLC
jgi:hypothetical protein